MNEVIVQMRDKEGQGRYEFPGGQAEQYESLFCALKRGVTEETGLDIMEATGQDGYVLSDESRSKAGLSQLNVLGLTLFIRLLLR